MAAGATATKTSPADVSAALRVAKNTEKRQRSFSNSIRSTANRLAFGASLLGAAPSVPDAQPQTPTTLESYSRDEDFRRTTQSNRVLHQIGPQLGLDNQRFGARAEDSPVAAAAREASEEQANILYANQTGQAERTSNAARGALLSARDTGQQNILQNVTKAGQKEIQKLGVSLTNGTLATVFSEGADMGVSDTLTSMHNAARAVVTIMVPEQKVGEIKDLSDVQKALFNEGINTFFPRYNLYTMSGLSGLVTFIGQFLLVSFLLLMLIANVMLIVGILNSLQEAIGNPLATWWNFGSSAWMYLLEYALSE
jgi:hypothetical protein